MRPWDAIHTPVHIRPAAVAGRFYPADAHTLRHDVEHYLNAAQVTPQTTSTDTSKIKAIIAPHAGYQYSAPVAASAYTHIQPLRGRVNRVVLIGPSHHVSITGLATTSASAFNSPFGPVPVDLQACQRIAQHPNINTNDAAHAPEHGLEVHLPFLIAALGDTASTESVGITIIPILFGDSPWEPVSQTLGPFFDDEQTLIVVSSDMSHFLDYNAAVRTDRDTADAICNLDIQTITPQRACGHTAVQGLIDCVKRRGLGIHELDVRNSGDTVGGRDRVVGYGSFLVC